ncbi:MAG: hypothetical protein M1365_12180, partial [Actinobacteria bacterium]|nr:hypothetical protein [Actinomycetota bacterium]
IKTKISEKYNPDSIDVQSLFKPGNHPKKKVKNFLDINALNSAENALSELFIKLENNKITNVNEPIRINNKSIDLEDSDKRELKKYVKDIILSEK